MSYPSYTDTNFANRRILKLDSMNKCLIVVLVVFLFNGQLFGHAGPALSTILSYQF